MADIFYSKYQQLLSEREKDLQLIAAKTGSQFSLEDVQQEVWILAKMHVDLDGSLDILIPDVQDKILDSLRRKLLSRSDRKIQNAAKLDQKFAGQNWGEPALTLQEKIATVDDQNPLTLLTDAEALIDTSARSRSLTKQVNGSLAHAYALLLEELGDMKSLAEYLRISVGQCRKRNNDAMKLACYQHHLPLTPQRRKITALFKPWRRFKSGGRKLVSSLMDLPMQLLLPISATATATADPVESLHYE